MVFRRPVSLFVGALALACAAAAIADDDHARARAAREAGQIVPLQTIVDRVQKEFTGTLVSVEFEDDDGRFIYKVKLLTPAGGIVKAEDEARDGPRRRGKRRGAEAARRGGD